MKHTPKKRPTERPKQTAFRLYDRERVYLRKIQRKTKMPHSEIVRQGIALMHTIHFEKQTTDAKFRETE